MNVCHFCWLCIFIMYEFRRQPTEAQPDLEVFVFEAFPCKTSYDSIAFAVHKDRTLEKVMITIPSTSECREVLSLRYVTCNVSKEG